MGFRQTFADFDKIWSIQGIFYVSEAQFIQCAFWNDLCKMNLAQ